MVLLEMLVGKGAATAGMGAVKMASASGSGTAISLLQPTHDLMRGVAHFTPPDKLSSMFAGLDTVADTVVQSVSQVSSLLTGEEDEDQRKATGFNCSIRPSVALICFSDALTSAAIFSSIGAPLDVPCGCGHGSVSSIMTRAGVLAVLVV
eukprot:Skav221585  [mRNA]  locus=scaffold1698:13835:21250:+ [translate_table: standard]